MRTKRTWSVALPLAAALASAPALTAGAGSVAPCGICSEGLAEADGVISGMSSSAYGGVDDPLDAPDPSWAYGMGWSATEGGEDGFVDPLGWLVGLISSAMEGDQDAVDDEAGYAFGMSSSALEGYVDLIAAVDLDEAHRAVVDVRALGDRHVALFSAPVELLGTRVVTWVDPGSLPTDLQRELGRGERDEPVLALLDPTLDPGLVRAHMARSAASYEPPDIHGVALTVHEPDNIHPDEPNVLVLDPALLGVDHDPGRGGLAAPDGVAAAVHLVLSSAR